MAAASFIPSGKPADTFHAVSISTLAPPELPPSPLSYSGLALLTSWVDKRFATRTLEVQEEKLQQSEAYLAEAAEAHAHWKLGLACGGGKATHLSEEWYRIYGFDPDQRHVGLGRTRAAYSSRGSCQVASSGRSSNC